MAQQLRFAVPHALLLGGQSPLTMQALQVSRWQQAVEGRQRGIRVQAKGTASSRVEIAEGAIGLDKQHQVGVGLDHFGQAPQVLFGLHAGGDIARDADHFHHGAGVGFADRPAGGFEPQVMAGLVADAVGHGVIAGLLQRLGGALHQQVLVLGMEQALHAHPAQLLRTVTEQDPAGRRGIEEAAVRGVAGNQVGGVLGDQPVQAPGLSGLAGLAHLDAGIPAARQHPLRHRVGNKAPDQDARAILSLPRFDGPALAQAGAHQRHIVDRQQLGQRTQRALGQQALQGQVVLQQLCLGVQQQARLRVGRQQRCTAGDAGGQLGQLA